MKTALRRLFYIVLTAIVLHNSYSIFQVSPTYVNGLIHDNTTLIRQLLVTVSNNKYIVKKLNYKPNDLLDVNVLVKTERGSGSGSIIKTSGGTYILTAAHVVDTGKVVVKNKKLETVPAEAQKITAVIKGKDYTAEIVKFDDTLDVAVLRVEKTLRIVPITIAKNSPKLGEIVWTVSNPGGIPDVINKGIFSKIGKKANLVATAGFFGSSGGMALNDRGEQIGVISTVMITRVRSFFPNITVYNGITKTKSLNKFLKGIL